MDAKPVSQSQAEIVHWMGILDANHAGNVHGGPVTKLCDDAAALHREGLPARVQSAAPASKVPPPAEFRALKQVYRA